MNKPNERKRSLRGNAMIEFALILPIFMIILVGIIDISILLYDKTVITNASREGARYGVLVRSPTYASVSSIVSYTKSYCADRLISFSNSPPEVTVTATPSSSPPSFGATLTVKVEYAYTDLLLHNFINHSNQYNLSATTIMTYE